jgi:hypothetical protein
VSKSSPSSPRRKLTPSSTRLRYRIREPGRAEAEATDDLRSYGPSDADSDRRDAGLGAGTRHAVRTGAALIDAVDQDRHPAETDAGAAGRAGSRSRDTGGRGGGCKRESPNISGQQTNVSGEQEGPGQQGRGVYRISIGRGKRRWGIRGRSRWERAIRTDRSRRLRGAGRRSLTYETGPRMSLRAIEWERKRVIVEHEGRRRGYYCKM